VEELLDKAVEEGFTPDSEEALHEVLDMMACKAAIKAGDRLSDDEMDELMRLRETVERSGSCPHGRATTVRLTIAELERLFDRR
jgi:DNA mismatch repair protein MutL